MRNSPEGSGNQHRRQPGDEGYCINDDPTLPVRPDGSVDWMDYFGYNADGSVRQPGDEGYCINDDPTLPVNRDATVDWLTYFKDLGSEDEHAQTSGGGGPQGFVPDGPGQGGCDPEPPTSGSGLSVE